MAKKFSMAELAREALGDVKMSEVDRLQTIDADRIDANTANFYDMDDLEELAASIELVGLIDPIKVKPVGERYKIIDGERRFRAMTEVLGWTEIFAIVRRPANDVVEELVLIEANRQQRRKMTAAVLSKEAERYTELLAQLKEAGVAIPGRLRDRVAEALQVSSTKLARLHAIRERLSPRMLERFDAGEINESMAYSLSRYAHGQQAALWDYGARTPEAVDILARRAGFSPTSRDASERQQTPEPEAPKTLEPTGTSWDAEAYLSQRRQVDDDFYLMLGLEADHFLAQLSHVTSRQDGIQTLKEHFGRDHSGWFYDEVCVNCSMKGLELGCEDRAIPFIERTWTDVYDMLCRFVLGRAARTSRVSKTNTKPAGLAWHRVKDDDLPPDDGEVVFWGSKDLRTAVAGSRVNYCQMWPEEYAWWAVVEGPEEEEI